MNFIIAFISVLLVSYLMISYFKRQQKYVLSKELSTIFDEMELNFIKNSKNLTNDEIAFIKVYKQISTNPEFLDVHLLLISKFESNDKKLSDKKVWFDAMFKQQDENFKSLVEKFDIVAGKLIKLSLYNSSFVLFVLKIFFTYLFVKGQFNIISFYDKLKRDFRFVTKNENILIQQQVAC